MKFEEYWRSTKDYSGHHAKEAARKAWNYQLELRGEVESENKSLKKRIRSAAKMLKI